MGADLVDKEAGYEISIWFCRRTIRGGRPSVAACQVGCSAPTPPEEVSTVRVTITVVPADVSCINLTAAGTTRTVERTFDVAAGASSVLAMNGIPTGDVVFTGRAFSTACAAVPPGANPVWISDPVTAPVVSGTAADVALVMRRNANANVSVDFPDEGVPSVATTTTLATEVNPAVTGQRTP